MMEKFDSIYADSVNDEIEFDIIFNSEEDGSIIESVDPDSFYDESGDEFDDDIRVERYRPHPSSVSDLDDMVDKIDSEEEDDDEDDDYYGRNHNYDDDDDEDDDEKYHDQNDYKCDSVANRIKTIDDLDRHVHTYNQGSDDYGKEVIHSGDSETDDQPVYPRQKYSDDDRKRIVTVEDLDDMVEDDGRLIDKVDNDGAPTDDVTPDDFHRPEYNSQDNSFETRNELKESNTIGDLDSLANHFDNTNNTGLESQESEDPASDESFEDGEDIDTVLGESSFEDFIRRYS